MNAAPLLDVRSVRKQFGDLVAVRDLSFSVHPGEIFGFLGPNGAGKTTTLRMTMGITRPDSGGVWFDGRDALDRTRCGYLPEERGLFEDMPALETLAYLGALRGMRAADARAEATRWLERLELGERSGDKVQTLSKGNQQKIQFVGAILHRPALAVLDEPFSGLDPLNQDLFLGLLRELRDAGTAVLLSAHQLDLVERLADRFLLIARGEAVLEGTLAELRRKAAGGVDEVIELDLAPRDGGAGGVEALSGALADVFAGRAADWGPGPDGGVRVAVPRVPDEDLAPLLAAIAGRARLAGVRSRSVPLHEIYLRAVRGTRGAGAVGEADLG
jgi:ABC-2 type transport system ATP-binding protein